MTASNITFNAIKHHVGFIRTFIKDASANVQYEELRRIGTSQMDLYIGALTIDAISNELLNLLAKDDFLAEDKYKKQLVAKDGYMEYSLSDGTAWTLRLGEIGQQYIHIHPSRYTKNTVRVKAGILKTAIAFLAERRTDFSTETINEIRINLGLSPIKSVDETKGIQAMLNIMKCKM
jgi:hypothetical protein